VNGLDVDVLGLGEKWKGGGGQKVNLVKKALAKMKEQPDFERRIVMVTNR